MKVLSLLQPWASLAVMGIKRWETRSWTTAYRGALLIHAGKSRKGAEVARAPSLSKHIPPFSELPFGCIVGQVWLSGIAPLEALQSGSVQLENMTLEQRAFGPYENGRWCWIFSDPIAFSKPLPIRGTLGLWEYHGPLPV